MGLREELGAFELWALTGAGTRLGIQDSYIDPTANIINIVNIGPPAHAGRRRSRDQAKEILQEEPGRQGGKAESGRRVGG